MKIVTCRKVRDILSILLASCKDKGIEPEITISEYSTHVTVNITISK